MRDNCLAIMVTGGNGFVGAHTMRQLAGAGFKLVSFHDVTSSTENIGVRPIVVKGDVRFLSSIVDAVKTHDVKRIIHTASLLGYESQENPMLAFEVNAKGTLNILEAARVTDLERVVYVSGQSVYGETEEDEMIAEEHPRLHRLGYVYPSLKCVCEDIGLSYVQNYGLDVIVVRLSLVYGPGKKTGYQFQKICVEDALFKKQVNIPQGGDQEWDWLYVKDAAHGLARAVLADGLKHRVFNIASGSGRTYSIRDFAAVVKKFVPEASFEIGPGVASEVENVRGPLDITRAREELGYAPRYSRLETGVQDYLQMLTGLE
jgi:UDP-glucose 4-epimerase